MTTAINRYWSMTDAVFDCLIDEERTLAFQQAIDRTVRNGDIVVDMGTGSGVLAMLAARAGARKVYAVELDRRNIATLDAVFRANGLHDKIVLIQGDVRKIDLPERVDVIIGEMIATALIEELQIPAMNNILRFSKPRTRVLLSRYKTYVDLVHNPEIYYGHSFKIVRYEYPDLRRLRSTPLSERHLVSDVDFTRVNSDPKVDARAALAVIRRGVVNGIRLSGETHFFDGSTLGATYAYSYPIILPVDTRKVARGDVIDVRIRYRQCGGMKTLRYAVL